MRLKGKIVIGISLIIIIFSIYNIFRIVKKNIDENKPVYVKLNNYKKHDDKNFNIKLIKTINSGEENNYLISPYSIEIALNMLKSGADKETLKEIDKLIGKRNIPLFNVDKRISVSNAIFIKNNYKNIINKDFTNNINKKFDGSIIYDKFDNPDKINKWVSINTYEMIEKILDSVNEDFVLGIANAIAIDVKWADQFDCNNTTEEEFIKDNKNKMNVEMMHKTFKYSNGTKYFKTDLSEGIIIPYTSYDTDGTERYSKNSVKLEFVGILPNDNVDEYINNLDNKEIKNIDKLSKSAGDDLEIELSLPRFSYQYELNNFIGLLNKLGINNAFDKKKADFTKIISKKDMKKSGINNLYVDEAIHKTYIDLNEKGTKAAAITYFGMFKASSALEEEKEIVKINFNKPFIYMIRDSKTKEILFFGVLKTPNKWNGPTCNNFEG